LESAVSGASGNRLFSTKINEQNWAEDTIINFGPLAENAVATKCRHDSSEQKPSLFAGEFGLANLQLRRKSALDNLT
jgi:hypothetical protein